MPDQPQAASPEPLGLVRAIDGELQPQIHTLSLDPQGTVIGSVPVEGDCITDVDADVDAQHLVIWQQDGRWWCQGLDSANGTAHLSGATKALTSLELPRRLRDDASTGPAPMELHAGDALLLGRSTRFLVLQLKG